jgi:hypothetical protein
MLTWSSSGEAIAQRRLRIPEHFHEPPRLYLQRLRVEDVDHKLTDVEKRDLCRLLVWSYIVTVRRDGRDTVPLDASSPIYLLFKSNFRNAPSSGPESDLNITGVFLEQVARYIYELPEYRAEVWELLRKSGK